MAIFITVHGTYTKQSIYVSEPEPAVTRSMDIDKLLTTVSAFWDENMDEEEKTNKLDIWIWTVNFL